MTNGEIFFCGDPHGMFDHIVHAVSEHRPAALILLGDNTPERPLHVELRIRTNIATHAHRKPATPTHLKVATHSHFKVAALRRAGVRGGAVIDNARDSNAARRQHPRTRRSRRVVGGNKDLTIEWRVFKRSNEY